MSEGCKFCAHRKSKGMDGECPTCANERSASYAEATKERWLYRGQAYGDAVGVWWTSSPDDALKFAMSRGGNRTFVVLEVQEDDDEWLSQFIYATDCGDHKATWYRIPLNKLRERWRGVKIKQGAISLEPHAR